MYLALKWLIGMVLTMWIALCSLDIFRKKSLTKQLEFDLQKLFTSFQNNKSFQVHHTSSEIQSIKMPNNYPHDHMYHQYLIFLAVVFMVAIFKRNNDITLFTKREFIKFNFDTMNAFLRKIMCWKKNAKYYSNTILKYSKNILVRILKINGRDINLILFNKLKELSQQRRNLGQMLITNIQENKNMKEQFRLETCVKCSERQIIENQSRIISFQQLYLLTHQENISLKSRLKKLTKEKENAESKLMKLINEVCLSKNSDLKAYCSQFIVQTKNNLLNSDVKAEIDKFLRKSPDFICFRTNNQFPNQTIQRGNFHSLSTKSAEIIGNENFIAEGDNAHEFRGLPGKHVWTVKDKDGIIEKLYEYDTVFDHGVIIRRIRQYSVYYDTECLFDLSNASTYVINHDADISKNEFTNIKVTVTNQRFLSSSPAFKNFLQNNNNIMVQR